jgi:hypothetical protein
MSEPHLNEPEPGAGQPVGLERRYRRLLAWYPRWFRLENEEEILAVLWMARANGQGRNRGRAAVAVFSGIVLLAVLDAVPAGGITYAPAGTAAGMVHGLVALAVVFLVFNPASSRHYRTSMRNRSSLA